MIRAFHDFHRHWLRVADRRIDSLGCNREMLHSDITVEGITAVQDTVFTKTSVSFLQKKPRSGQYPE